MKTIKHPVFLLIFVSYVIYYTLKHLHISMPELITSYFADLVSLFIINTFILFVIRRVYSKPRFELPIIMVIISLLAVTAIFEWIQPMWNSSMVADPIDIICYTVSAILYVIWRKNWRLF